VVAGSDGVQVGDGDADAWFAAPVPTNGTVAGIGVSLPIGSPPAYGENVSPDGGVKVGKLNGADAGQVLASSRY